MTFLAEITDHLESILNNGTIDHFEPYSWDNRPYLRVFMTGRDKWSWDGPMTDKALQLVINAVKRKRKL